MARCRCCGKDWPPGMSVCPEGGDELDDAPTEVLPPVGMQDTYALAHDTGETDSIRISSELVPGTMLGEYRIEKKIGQGAMGMVYAAVHPLIGKKAAIKVISQAVTTSTEI